MENQTTEFISSFPSAGPSRESSPLTRMVFGGPGQPHRKVTNDQPPPLAPSELLVRLTLATICGSDLHTYEGRRDAPTPCVLGHEGVGVIVACGSPEDTGVIGRRITWTLTDTCGACPACLSWDLPQKCDSLFKYGHAALDHGSGYNGCFASHLVLRTGTRIVFLPDDLPDCVVAPANCALATMVAALEKVPPEAKRILIQGAGLLGIYGCALLRDRGVKEIFVSDPVASRLSLIEDFGGRALSDGEKRTGTFDAIIEVAGVPEVIEEGLALLRPGGTYVLAGMVHDDTALKLKGVDLVRGCLTLVGVHNYAAHHLEEGIAFLRRAKADFPWDKLVSPPIPLSKIDEAFALSQSREWPRVSVIPDFPDLSS
jgi:putative phosphonate catabolism associated alcohol dehydrogenase